MVEVFDADAAFEEEGDEGGFGILGDFGKDGFEAGGEVWSHVVGHLHGGDQDFDVGVLVAGFGDDTEQVLLGFLGGDAAQAVVAAEGDDEDVGSFSYGPGDPAQAAGGGLAADAGAGDGVGEFGGVDLRLKQSGVGFFGIKAVCCGFALLPLMRIREISPAVTLRSGGSLKGGLLRALPVYGLLVGLLVMVVHANDPNWKGALAMVGGMAVAFLALVAVARGLMSVTRRAVGMGWPYLLRQGVSNLHRPGNQTLLFLLSLGLGTFLLVTILSAGRLLNDRLDLQQSEESPNLYLIDVQPDQVAGVKEVLEAEGLPMLESAPMVTMRINSIRGVEVGEAEGVARWVARREFRSTYRAKLNFTVA